MLKIKFRFNETHKDGFNELGKLNNLFIDLTSRCNMSCCYCFNYGTVMNASPIDLPIHIFQKLFEDDSAKNISNWFLSGGEPILYPHMDELLGLFQHHGIRPKIATNGSLLTPEVIDKWLSYNVGSVQVSVDTLSDTNFQNITCSGPKVLKKTLANLEYAVKSPLRTVVSSTLSKLNFKEISDMLPYFMDLGVDSYTIYLLTPGAVTPLLDKFLVDFSQLPVLVDQFLELYCNYSQTKIVDINLPWILRSPIYRKWKDNLELRVHGCGAGQYTLGVKANGDISPCICQSSEEFICGNLSDSTLSEIWESQEIENYRFSCLHIPECSDCRYLPECRGGCRSNGFVFGNKGLQSVDPLCKFFR